MAWVTRTTVTPRRRRSFTRAQVSRRAAGSSPAASSSSTTISGSPSRARAMNSRCFCPPDRLPKAVDRCPARPHSSRSRSGSACRGRPRRRSPSPLDLHPVRQHGLLQLHPEPLPDGVGIRGSRPRTRTRTGVRRPHPDRAFHAGGLPAPLGPSTPSTSPRVIPGDIDLIATDGSVLLRDIGQLDHILVHDSQPVAGSRRTHRLFDDPPVNRSMDAHRRGRGSILRTWPRYCRSPNTPRTWTGPGPSTPSCWARSRSASSIRPGWCSSGPGSVRLLLEQNAASALIYLKVDDVAATVEPLRADGVPDRRPSRT